MGKRTREEIEAELAALDADDDPEDDEVEIGHPDGRYFRGTHRRARAVARQWGIAFDPDPVPEEEPEGEAGKAGPKRKPAGKQQQGGQVRAFRGRGVG